MAKRPLCANPETASTTRHNEDEPSKDKGTLTAKQMRFVEEYPKDFNATQAAIRAGYAKKAARQIGFENLTKPDIQAAIQALQRADSAKIGLERQQLLETAYLATNFDPARLWTKDKDRAPRLLHPTEWPEDVKRAMTVVVTARGVEYRPKVAAIDGLEFCMKYAMFEDGGPQGDPHAEEIAKRTAARVAARMGITPAS